jgi:hypothetical protein
MKKLISILLAAYITFASIGCATPPERLATPSGMPEIVISGTSKKLIIDTIVNDKLSSGFKVISTSEYSLVVAKDIDDFAARAAYGSNYNRIPEARSTYSLVDVPGGVKLFVRAAMVTNPRSPYEKTVDFTSTWGTYAQAELSRLKQMLEK